MNSDRRVARPNAPKSAAPRHPPKHMPKPAAELPREPELRAPGDVALSPAASTPAGECLHSTASHSPTGVSVRLADEVDANWRALLVPLVPASAQALWQALLDGPVSLRDIEQGRLPNRRPAARAAEASSDRDAPRHAPADETGFAVTDAFILLGRLWACQALVIASAPHDAAIEIRAGAQNEPLDLGVQPLVGRTWRASRFASLRGERGADGAPIIFIEYPAGTVLTRIAAAHAPRAAAFFASFLVPRELAADGNSADDTTSGDSDGALLFLLAVAGVVAPANGQGEFAEDGDPLLRQWEHHDLLMHFRSRQGRHLHDMGASFRFKGILDPQPVLKANPWRENAIALPRPDLHALAASDPPFTAVLEMRRSIRTHNDMQPIDLTRIGHFLFRSSRVRSRYPTEIGEFTSRPYPSGGASHELEIYLSVDRASDLARGFYYYDPAEHTLCLVRGPDADMAQLLHNAWISSARMCRPQVLITLASRFQRVSWKYNGMAYATQLKNVGVLYQTFYLVATSMNLAGCALGLGDAQCFARMAGTDYLRESSVGEFMLGTPAG